MPSSSPPHCCWRRRRSQQHSSSSSSSNRNRATRYGIEASPIFFPFLSKMCKNFKKPAHHFRRSPHPQRPPGQARRAAPSAKRKGMYKYNGFAQKVRKCKVLSFFSKLNEAAARHANLVVETGGWRTRRQGRFNSTCSVLPNRQLKTYTKSVSK